VVEWDQRRAIIPKTSLDGDEVSQEVLEQGIPYGLPWGELIKVKITAQMIEEALHSRGIWTAEDALRNSSKVKAAFLALITGPLQSVFTIAKERQND
jgi:hypothetical protein